MHWLGVGLLVLFAGIVALGWSLHPLAGLGTLVLGLAAAWLLLHFLPTGGVAVRLRQRRRPHR
jgi:hypothetical protein